MEFDFALIVESVPKMATGIGITLQLLVLHYEFFPLSHGDLPWMALGRLAGFCVHVSDSSAGCCQRTRQVVGATALPGGELGLASARFRDSGDPGQSDRLKMGFQKSAA